MLNCAEKLIVKASLHVKSSQIGSNLRKILTFEKSLKSNPPAGGDLVSIIYCQTDSTRVATPCLIDLCHYFCLEVD
jgi:hypothetical protein